MRRHSIAALMAVVLVAAVSIAALRDASDTWAGILLLLTLLLLGTALLGVLHRRGAKRAFWQGFALFGWGYLVLAQAPWFAEQVGPKLPTTALLNYTHGRINPSKNPNTPFTVSFTNQNVALNGQLSANAAPTVVQLQPSGSGTPPQPQTFTFFLAGPTNLDQFQRVGHCLFALLAALLGAGIARWFQRTDRETPAASRDDPASGPSPGVATS